MRISRIPISLAAAGLLATLLAAEAPPDPAVEDGRRLFEIYCVSCHGPSGRGDGEAARADLAVPPADLTALTTKDGKFPTERITRSIDGRDTRAHGSPMPVWGLDFQNPESDVYQEGEVDRRIAHIVEFLRTIQNLPPSAE